jgi:uncharacterized protein with HEPN domain
MKKDALIFIKHVLEYIEKIEVNLKGANKKVFLKDENLHDATIRRLEIIGEAIKNVPLSFRKKYPQIEWKLIAGFRDKLIHHYFGVDNEKVWGVIKDELPILKEKIKFILDSES